MKINVNNLPKIENEVDATEQGCTARLFNVTRIPDIIGNAEKRLVNLKIPKKYWVGCKINCCPGAVPNKYKYPAEGTFATITRFASGWFVTGISRYTVGNTAHGRTRFELLTLSKLAHDNFPFDHKL